MPNGGPDIISAAAPDPVTGALIEVAKAAAKKAVELLAAKISEGAGCVSSEEENRELITKTFCAVVRGIAGLDDKEWRDNITNKLSQISTQISIVDAKINQINAAVGEVLKQLRVVELGLQEILRGNLAYESLTQIQTVFQEFSGIMKELETTSISDTQGSSKVQATRIKQRLQSFYLRLLEGKIHQQVNVVFTSLTAPLANKDSLLRIVLNTIEQKLKGADLVAYPLQITKLFEAYVSAILMDLAKGYVLYSQAAQFVHMNLSDKTADLPYTVEEWTSHYKGQQKNLLNSFNTEIERMVLLQSLGSMGKTSPYFLDYAAEYAFASADQFTSLMLDEPYGIRGRIFSMGNLFNGKIKLPSSSGREIQGTRHEVNLGKQVDWWVARTSDKGVYDEVRFSDTWIVYRYHVPDLTSGTYPLVCGDLPYTPGAVLVDAINAQTMQRIPPHTPIPGTGVFHFGSFAEVQRAGGAFALLSGGWSPAKIEDKHTGGGAADFKENSGRVELTTVKTTNDRWKAPYHMKTPPSQRKPYPDSTPTLRTYNLLFFEVVAAVWGRVEWKAFASNNSWITRRYSAASESKKKISCPEARRVNLTINFKTSSSYTLPDSYLDASYRSVGTICRSQFSFSSSLATNRGCTVKSAFNLTFSGHSYSLHKEANLTTPASQSLNRAEMSDASILTGSIPVIFDGKELSLSVEAFIDCNIETSGTDKTNYSGLARFSIDSISFGL